MEKVTASLTPEAVEKLKASEEGQKGIFKHLSDGGTSVECDYDFGDDIEDMVERFGDEVCKNMIRGHIKFGLQGAMRRWLTEGLDADEIQEKVAAYLPGLSKPKKSAVEKERDRLSKLDPETREREKEALRALLDSM